MLMNDDSEDKNMKPPARKRGRTMPCTCSASELCQSTDRTVCIERKIGDEEIDGDTCSVCGNVFHYVCLFMHQRKYFCSPCYKQNVVNSALESGAPNSMCYIFWSSKVLFQGHGNH